MILKVTTVLSIVSCVLGHGHHKAISEQKVTQHFEEKSELSHIGDHKPEHHKEYAWSYPSYEFSYKVEDPHTHDYKGQHETRDGDHVKGEYWLVEPDGAKRTVSYSSDKHTGYKAVVHYSMPHHHSQYKTEEHHMDEEQDEGHNDDGRGDDGRGGDDDQDRQHKKSYGQELGLESGKGKNHDGHEEREGQSSYHKPMPYQYKLRRVTHARYTHH